MPRKGKKKDAPPLLVAPEPLADELEADMLWDHVKEVDDKPPFMDGTLFDATHTAFEGEKGFNGLHESSRVALGNANGPRRRLQKARARDHFTAAEKELQEMKDRAQCLKEDVTGFQLLKLSETKEAEQEKKIANDAVLRLLTDLSDTQLILLEDMEEESDKFFKEIGELLQSVCSLGASDILIEEAFLEQQTMQEKCRTSEKVYHRDHGEHVDNMNKMQQDTKQLQDEMLTSMINRLRNGVDEMTKLSEEELEDKTAQQEERSQLIIELVKLQAHSVALQRKTTATSETRAELQRAISLEIQKHEMCTERQRHLRKEVKDLAESVRKNNLGLLQTTSTANPSAAYKATLPMLPVSPNTITNLNDASEERNRSLQALEAKRELEEVSKEVSLLRNKLWNLRRQHLVQLSGQYQPITFDQSLRTTQSFFLDAETNAAVRAVVVESLLEVSQCVTTQDTEGRLTGTLERLVSVTDQRERKVIQDFVAKRINKLFSCVCPTAPPLLFLREAAHVQSEM